MSELLARHPATDAKTDATERNLVRADTDVDHWHRSLTQQEPVTIVGGIEYAQPHRLAIGSDNREHSAPSICLRLNVSPADPETNWVSADCRGLYAQLRGVYRSLLAAMAELRAYDAS